MSDSDDSQDLVNTKSLQEISHEIEECKRNPETSGMFVSGWDDADEGVDVVEDYTANPINHILWAAENGRVDTLRELLAARPELVSACDADGYTALHRAAYSDQLPALALLLAAGAPVLARTQLGWSPLHSACNWNNYRVAARLLAAGADPAALSDGEQTPLHLAAAISHCKSTLLVLLLREDTHAAARAPNHCGDSPESLARSHGIYSCLFKMVHPAVSYIHSTAFTCNPYVRSQLIHKSQGTK